MTFKEDTKIFEKRDKIKIICKCGHSVFIPAFNEKTLCSWCGNYVFKDKKEQFKHELLKNIKR